LACARAVVIVFMKSVWTGWSNRVVVRALGPNGKVDAMVLHGYVAVYRLCWCKHPVSWCVGVRLGCLFSSRCPRRGEPRPISSRRSGLTLTTS